MDENMPPLFDIRINVVVLLIIMIGCVLLGYVSRSRQMNKRNRRIFELEKQMLDLDAEILDVQREYAELEARVKHLAIPVIPLRREEKVVVEKQKADTPREEGGEGAGKRSDRSA